MSSVEPIYASGMSIRGSQRGKVKVKQRRDNRRETVSINRLSLDEDVKTKYVRGAVRG